MKCFDSWKGVIPLYGLGHGESVIYADQYRSLKVRFGILMKDFGCSKFITWDLTFVTK